jgi:hypothetical protein
MAPHAAAAELVLEWRAPAECPDRDELSSRVSRLLGGAVKSSFTAVTDVTHTDGTYRARLRTTSSAGFGERVLENVRCEDLTDSVALVIALTAAPANDNGHEAEGFGIAVAATANLAQGALASPALGFGGALAAEGFSALRIELRGAYYLRQSTTFDGSSLGGDFDLVTVAARGCRLWSFGVFDIAPCIGADLYHVSSSGFGSTATRSNRTAWWGPALGLFARARLTDAFSIYLAADGVMPVSRRPFVFPDVGELHRPSVVALQLLIAPEARF